MLYIGIKILLYPVRMYSYYVLFKFNVLEESSHFRTSSLTKAELEALPLDSCCQHLPVALKRLSPNLLSTPSCSTEETVS